jgi:Flp pilus assembly protein TadD
MHRKPHWLAHPTAHPTAHRTADAMTNALAVLLTRAVARSMAFGATLVASGVLAFSPGCSSVRDGRDSPTRSEPLPAASDASSLAVGSVTRSAFPSLMLGTFDFAGTRVASARTGRSGQAPVELSIEDLRRPLPVVQALPPLGDDVARLLGRAAEALARNDLEAAEVAASDAAEIAPERPEPVEVQFLVALGSGRPSEVRKAIVRLAEIDPRNAIPIAFAGLESIQNGDDEGALASLSWFVGRDALPRRGVAVPLPTAAAELEEQCALAAMRMGHPRAALAALDAAAASVAADMPGRSRLLLVRADALHAAGEFEGASDALERVVASAPTEPMQCTEGRAITMLASIRLDVLRCSAGLADAALESAVAAFVGDPSSSFAILRVERLAVRATEAARERSLRRVMATGGSERALSLRFATVEAMLSRRADQVELVKATVADATDRSALRIALRLLAARGVERAAGCAIEASIAQPNEIDSLARALLGCGADVETVLAALSDARHGAAGDALRSRIYGQFGFPEEAFAIAAAARARDRASAVALAACALAAAELEDETLLAEIDDDALAAGNATARTLAAAALRVGDFTRAGERAARAIAFDPRDSRARLIAAIALREGGVAREDAMKELRELAAGSDSVSADAFLLLFDFERAEATASTDAADASGAEPAAAEDGDRLASGGLVSPREPAQVLAAAARDLDRMRHPLALECLALAEELDPALESGRRIASRASRPDAPRVLDEWARLMLADAPALPSRRRILAALQEPRSSTEIPASPLHARFDSLQLASEGVRARDRVARGGLRPRTPSAVAAQADALLKAGQTEDAVRQLESISGSTSGPMPAGAARRMLGVASELSSRHPQHAPAMQRVATHVVARLAAVGPEEMAAVMRLAIVARADPSEIDSVATVLARACRSSLVDPREQFARAFRNLLATDDDPYPVARLADALAREERLDPALRSFLCNAAVALQAASGGPASQSIDLIKVLSEQGVAAFARGTEAGTMLAESLLRASSAYSLVGDGQGSDELLRAAIDANPQLASALNNLAFSQIEAGRIDPETVVMAERAAQLAPDDPAVLDTLGVLRYHHGRFRDDAGGPGAITLFRQALRVDPDDPSLATLDHLGDALWRDGDQAGAIRCWQQVAQVAKLRYPPDGVARSLRDFQLREFGLELVSPVEFVQKQYGRIVDRAEQKLQEVARGVPPSVADRLGLP